MIIFKTLCMRRRNFLKASGLILGGLPLGWSVKGAGVQDLKHIKISCNMYSFNQQLTKGEMTLEEAIDFCAELDFDAVDPTAYYFTGYPEVPSDPTLYGIKRRAFVQGMDISGTGIRTDFSLPDPRARQQQVELTRRWLEAAAKLDAPVLRVFAGRQMPEGYEKARVFDWIIASLQECALAGADHGVIIVLQNHFDVLKSVEDVKYIMDAIDSEWFALNLDIGSCRLGDPYAEIAQLTPYAQTWQIKEHVYRQEVKEKVDLHALAEVIKTSGYRGYFPLETLPPSDPRQRLGDFKREIVAALSA